MTTNDTPTLSQQAEAILLDHGDNPEVIDRLVRDLASKADSYFGPLKHVRDLLENEQRSQKQGAAVPYRSARPLHRVAEGVPPIVINLGGRVRRFVSERDADGQIRAMIEEPVVE